MAMPGGVFDVNANTLEIENLARFAIDEHNKKENSKLEFKKVVNAKQQVVAGMMYYITMEAMDVDKKKTYEAKVWMKIDNSKELVDFKLIGDALAACTATA